MKTDQEGDLIKSGRTLTILL